MASEHISIEDVADYRRGKLGPRRLLAIGDHIAECELCRRQLVGEEQLASAIAFLRAEIPFQPAAGFEHLSYDELEGFVDFRLTGADHVRAEGHVKTCGQCRAEAKDLWIFKHALEEERSRANKLLLLGIRARRVALQIAAMLIIAALAVWVATRMLQRQVVDLKGRVSELEQERDRLQNNESTISELRAEVERLREGSASVSQPGNLVVVLSDSGRTIALDKHGSLSGLERVPSEYLRLAQEALQTQRAVTPAGLSRLTRKAGILLGGPQEGVSFALTSPVGTMVRSNRPVFRWHALGGATAYVVAIYDANFNEVATSPSLPTTEWQPQGVLDSGKIYSWQVTAERGQTQITSPSPPAPEARFEVLSPTDVVRLQRAENDLAGSHLMLGLLYAQAGLLDEAEQELVQLTKENPKSVVAKNLLGSIKRLRH